MVCVGGHVVNMVKMGVMNGMDRQMREKMDDDLGGPCLFFFSSRRRHTRLQGDWSSDVCSSDLRVANEMGLSGRRFHLLPHSPFATRHSPYSIITSGSPNSTGWPSSTRICVTVPARDRKSVV